LNRYLKYLKIFSFMLVVLGAFEFIMIASKKQDIDAKIFAVKAVGMPDLALSTEAHFIRHRSLTDMVEVFGLGSSLLPYFPSTFVYAPPQEKM